MKSQAAAKVARVSAVVGVILARRRVPAGDNLAQTANWRPSGPEFSFDIWDWTAPAQDLALLDKWAADLKSICVTRVEQRRRVMRTSFEKAGIYRMR